MSCNRFLSFLFFFFCVRKLSTQKLGSCKGRDAKIECLFVRLACHESCPRARRIWEIASKLDQDADLTPGGQINASVPGVVA